MARFFRSRSESTISETPTPKIPPRVIFFIFFKWIGIGIVVAALGLFLYEVIEDGKIAESVANDSDKVVEINKTMITGYRDLVMSWKMEADHIWTGRNRFLFRGELVKNGSVYDSSGKLVIGEITASEVMVNSRTRTVTVSRGVLAALMRRSGENTDPIKIDAGELRYFEISSKAYLSNHVILHNKSAEAVANDVTVDTETNIADINGAFQVTANEFLVKSDQMRIFIDDGAAELQHNVKGFRRGAIVLSRAMDERERILKSLDTTLRADYLRYQEVSGNKKVRIQGNIKLEQADKLLMGDTAHYDRNADEFIIEGNVKLTAANLNWAFRSGQLGTMGNKEIKEVVSNSLILIADKMLFYGGNKRSFRISGNITMIQPGKILTCQICEYDDQTQKMTFSGGVRVLKNNTEKLTANRLILDIKNETFSADDRIVGEFNIDRKPAVKGPQPQ